MANISAQTNFLFLYFFCNKPKKIVYKTLYFNHNSAFGLVEKFECFNKPIIINKGFPLSRRKCLDALALSKTQHTGLQMLVVVFE